MKVSKESIVGVIAALERYADRDPDEEYNLWKSRIETIFAGVSDLPELRVTVCTHGMNGQPYPNLQIESGNSKNGMTVRELLLMLRQRHPAAQPDLRDNSRHAESRSSGGSTSVTKPTYRNAPRNIILAEDEQSPDRAFLYAQCLQPGDAEEIVFAIRQAVTTFRDRVLT